MQTLRQLIIQYGICLPCLYIEDYPQIPVRGWFMDVTRGRIPKLSYLKEMADRCSLYKINQMHLYIEHTFYLMDSAKLGEMTRRLQRRIF